ncbi:hypothetical protein C8J36_11083 [Rhizobium sp. PP-F2F-G48]|uniref:hypothetical protein n=1 Tax=Rhizobium sp. PP-F2F-G48 TaxID=2135651 RepID=UPI0010E6740F|nr:hypothetical protein [Rhizobium sp. PP-F2F-G48]TCM51076.1 hypothetical protein C8J36_11083 [Rhizobium sp. PP-F2F-G48]
MPAPDRYDGPLWRTLRTVDPNGENARVAFLSAHLGLRASDTPIETYDARMTEAVAAAMKAGGLGTRWPRPRTQARVMPEGDHPGEHIAGLTDFGRSPFADVALVGGHLYLDVMRHFVGLFRENGYVTTDVRVTEINGPIGCMRRDLRLWLNGGGEGR